ncbi:OmpA family protein [Sulfitobacter sp. F26169L]|uniref:OmpA family protein n=1 Tax=Sulfitobacter sp. F26169L TaxID=2996015 RepID=UPI003A4C7E4B
MTKRNIIIGSVVSATLGLSACTSTSSDPVYTQFYSEAGSLVDAGDFGNSTLNNRLVMTGERQYTFDLARRFSTEVDSTVNFAFNSAQLDRTAQAILRQQANWIRQFPEIRFRVYGHTDAVGSNRANKSLGQRRANAVVNYFSTLGISRQRLEAVVSFGETQPLVVTQGRERRNRRTVTEVSGFVKRHPTVMDGKYAQIIYRDYVNSAVSQPTLSSTTVQGLDG